MVNITSIQNQHTGITSTMYSGYKSSSHTTVGGTTIGTTNGDVSHNWQFGVDGRLTFPDATVQTTAYTGQSGLSGYSGFSGINGVDTIPRQDTPPTNGTLWFNTVEGRMYIKYSDVWVDASPLVMPQPDPDIDVASVTFADASVQTTAFVGTAVVDRLTNGELTVVLNSNGDLISSNDIIAVQGGRFIKDCGDSGSTTSMRWINIPDDQQVQIIRVYTGDPAGVGDAEKLQLTVEQQTATQSGLSIISFDRTGPSTTEHNWQFRGDGATTFPTLTVPISDNTNPSGTGQTLKFSDPTQQAIIYGPAATTLNNNAERIIIQGAPGFTGTSGEGGDVYVWAGPGGSTNGGGGDIKVRAGQANGTGSGGYLNFQAGDSGTGTGGYINIESGSSNTSGQGGDITLDARSGGEIILRTDNGSTNKNWIFDKDGDLTLPLNTVISETSSSPGLFKRKYSGTFVLDPTWFVTNAGNLIETTTPLSIIQSTDLEVFGAFCFEFTGYFVPPTSANYTFKAHADETFIFWMGSKALSDYTYANKDMYGDYNGTGPEQQVQSFTIALTAGQFYPIRLQWGNSAGWGQLDTFTWANDAGQADTANFSGRIYTANTGTAKITVNDNKSIILSTDNATVNNWTFGANGGLTLPEGSVISETATTTVITPPGAAAGQSLVIRPTAVTNLSASGYIVPGVNLTITLTNGTITVYDGDPIPYTITGTTAQQLGLGSLTGTFPAFSPIDSVPQSTTLVLPIPEYTSAHTFTLTVGGTNPFAASFITVTDNNVIETSHIHLVSGDPVTTDIYLGDDDQYVKIEKNGGNVVVGTNSNTHHWVFDTNGDLTFPDNTVQTTAYVAALNATKVTGTWTVVQGAANYSFTVPLNGVYQLWVRGNVPNGIVTYTATASVTNTNVPVVGTQYAWWYVDGGVLEFTSIPNQFEGTEGVISNTNTYVGNTANVFEFGITKTGAGNAVVSWGYTKIS
jgi:hypothetical protein